jgi:hypothetical protein
MFSLHVSNAERNCSILKSCSNSQPIKRRTSLTHSQTTSHYTKLRAHQSECFSWKRGRNLYRPPGGRGVRSLTALLEETIRAAAKIPRESYNLDKHAKGWTRYSLHSAERGSFSGGEVASLTSRSPKVEMTP